MKSIEYAIQKGIREQPAQGQAFFEWKHHTRQEIMQVKSLFMGWIDAIVLQIYGQVAKLCQVDTDLTNLISLHNQKATQQMAELIDFSVQAEKLMIHASDSNGIVQMSRRVKVIVKSQAERSRKIQSTLLKLEQKLSDENK